MGCPLRASSRRAPDDDSRAVYTTLDRLEAKGLLRWKLEAGGPERQALPKRVYWVLPRGVTALRTSQRVLRRMWRGLDRILKDPS